MRRESQRDSRDCDRNQARIDHFDEQITGANPEQLRGQQRDQVRAGPSLRFNSPTGIISAC